MSNIITQLQRQVWIYKYPIDMRKSIDSLAIVVAERMQMNPYNGNIYVFFSYNANRAKLLFWDNDGFVVVYKRLETSKFAVPRYTGQNIAISQKTLKSLLRGVIDVPSPQTGLNHANSP